MTTNYTDTPLNIADIVPYVMMDKTNCAQEILMADKCFFYDTCAFRKHTELIHPEDLFDFIKRKQGIVIITRTILMELASQSQSLNLEYVDYIRKMFQSGLKVLVIYEEDIFDVLSLCFSSNAQINQFLGIAVKVAKNVTGTMTEVLKSDRSLGAELMSANNTDRMLFARFFSTVRNYKESGDSLGEEMIAVCGHMLANIPELQKYKYIVMTEDKGAIGLINKTQKNIQEYLNRRSVTAVTTVALGQKLYKENMLTTKEQVEEFISTGVVGGIVRIVASEEYDLGPQEKTMTCGDVADLIVSSQGLHIYY